MFRLKKRINKNVSEKQNFERYDGLGNSDRDRKQIEIDRPTDRKTDRPTRMRGLKGED